MDEFRDSDDVRIRAALHDVDVPLGLRERLCNRLQTELDATASPLAAVDAAVDATVHRAPAPRVSRLPRRLFSLALAVGVSGLLLAYYRFSRPMSAERLASHCGQLLDQFVSSGAAWQSPNEDSQQALRILARQIKPNVPLGFQDLSGRPFSEHCRVWELLSYATNKRFYVLEFEDPVIVDQLARQLQAMNSPVSGNWNLFAMQTDDRLVVVAFQGTATDFLYPPQSA
jgi:plasmid stability protein